MTSITPSSPDALGRVDTPSDFTTCFAISGGVTFGRTISALHPAVHNGAVGQTIAASGGRRGVNGCLAYVNSAEYPVLFIFNHDHVLLSESLKHKKRKRRITPIVEQTSTERTPREPTNPKEGHAQLYCSSFRCLHPRTPTKGALQVYSSSFSLPASGSYSACCHCSDIFLLHACLPPTDTSATGYIV